MLMKSTFNEIQEHVNDKNVGMSIKEAMEQSSSQMAKTQKRDSINWLIKLNTEAMKVNIASAPRLT